ncbi:GPN-loop GTPase 3 [Cichlidogyrus casuarinus]|uniref:GPN-loop GTPase 3 n=1 Tax=Cichlidogyrus casuarinus TaxID=1844966 RepID=A0ABD2QHA7_9PLAT
MPRFAQLVIGPAGCGKSSYCSLMQKHCHTIHHECKVVNLDPAAEYFDYEPDVDIRELIELDDVMMDDELKLGPNGGLVYCLEHLVQNLDWLDKEMGEDECDYFLFDCPGQIELYSHLPIMPKLVEYFQRKWDFRFVSVYILDARFLVDSSHLLAGMLSAMSAMLVLGTGHVNIMSKMDLLSEKQRKLVNARFLEPDTRYLVDLDHATPGHSQNFRRLTQSLADLLDQYSMIQFFPVNPDDEETIQAVLIQIDFCLQYDENVESHQRLYDQAEMGLSSINELEERLGFDG